MNDVRQASVTMVKTEGCRCLSHHAHPHPHYHDDYYNLITCVDWLGAGCQLTGDVGLLTPRTTLSPPCCQLAVKL